MVQVRDEQLQRAVSKIVDDGRDIHISGEPGIGKTEFLEHVKTRLPAEYTIEETTVRIHHDIPDIERDLLHIARRAAVERDSKPNQVTSASGSAFGFSGGATVDDRVRDLYKLEDLTTNWSGDPLVICIDDVHKIADDEQTARGVVSEIADVLGDEIHLITVGQISAIKDVEELHLNLYTLKETRKFLEAEYGDIPEGTIKEVHSKVEGHPLYLSLLTESTEDAADFELPEDAVFDTIEKRYIESLPAETEQFLRQVAVLPELSERTCSGIIDDRSATEIDRMLRRLNRQVIVQEVNRSDAGDKIYKIHERFRRFLMQKHPNPTRDHRTALEHHFEELLQKIGEESDETWKEILPHSFHLRFHLTSLHDEVTPEYFLKELDQCGITHPERGILVFFGGVGVFPARAIELFQTEHEAFSEWLLENAENELTANLLVQITDWALSQVGDDDPIELSEVRVEGSMDDLPIESQPFDELDVSEAQARHLENSLKNILSYFLIEEPYRSSTHRRQAHKQIESYGISYELLSEFRAEVKQTLVESQLGDEFESLVEQYVETVGQELEGSLTSSLDFHSLRDQMMELGRHTFDDVHEDLFIDTGVLEEITINGGDVLEQAENPAFAMLWYHFYIAYLGEQPSAEVPEEIQERYLRMVKARKAYEAALDKPMFTAEDTEDLLALDTGD